MTLQAIYATVSQATLAGDELNEAFLTTVSNTLCPFCAPIMLHKTSLRGELRLAPHAPSPGWHMFLLVLL